MYSDLFDHLGSNAGGGGASSSASSSNEKQLVSFKAGKMEMQLQENGHYWASPDTKRGEIRITWKTNESTLYWEWFDRREKTVAEDDKHVLWSSTTAAAAAAAGGSNNNADCGTFSKVTNAPNPAPQDRLYVWSRPQAGSDTPSYHMYWLQDASEEKDDELVAKVNQYLADPASANPTSSTTGTSGSSGAAASASGGSDAAGGGGGGTSSSSTDRQQVDALSNILENLGMPQAGDSSSSSPAGVTAAAATGAGAAATGTLTLADLQGAMAGLQQSQPGPPLQELVTPAAISSLMENDAVKARLLELLPEGQQSDEFLEENLRSPQIQQTLRSLTAALMPDDSGSMDGFHSVLANFGMAEGAQEALQANSNNPIQAFLECVLKSVEKEKEGESKDEEEESKE